MIKGTITEISELKEGVTKSDGSPYKAMSFLVDNGAEYNNTFSFDLFQMGEKENIDNFLKYNKVGQQVEVKFNVKTNKAQDGSRYYTSLSAWSIFAGTREEAPVTETADNLPF